MKQPTNEIKRIQQLANILKEEYDSNPYDILDDELRDEPTEAEGEAEYEYLLQELSNLIVLKMREFEKKHWYLKYTEVIKDLSEM